MEAEIIQAEDTEVYVIPRRKVVAENVPYEEYLTGKYGQHVEWVYGAVIAMSPVAIKHDKLSRFLSVFLMFTLNSQVVERFCKTPL
jgi:hypothetical protein